MKRFIIKTLLKFRYAFRGLVVAFKTQSSFRVHTIAAAVVIPLGIGLNISIIDWIMTAVVIMFVIVTELFNTAIEHICDYVQPEYHKMIKVIKDVAAGAVLVSVFLAIIVGCLVFIPAVTRIMNG